MGLGKFIKDGGLFGKMRGYDSDKKGHWYGFEEFTDDITNLGIAVEKTREIPNRVTIGSIGFSGSGSHSITDSTANNTELIGY